MKKSYSGITNSQMLEGAQTIKDLFTQNLAAFTALDHLLDQDYGDALQEKIDAAIKFPTDDTVNNEIGELTNNMKKAWKDCAKHFQDVKYFVEKAFSGNAAPGKVFGYANYEDMVHYSGMVKRFMEQFDSAANKYKSELLAAGCRQADIDAIPTLTTTFINAFRALKSAKKNRLESTQTRTIMMNDIWRTTKTINRKSKKVYSHSPSQLRQFFMPAGKVKVKAAKVKDKDLKS